MHRNSTKMNYNEYKICLLGETCVGKSSIVQRFVHNTFNSGNETIGASFMTKTLFVNGISCKLNIWDTAGQERYKALTPMYYRGANICIVVYDVTCMKSFEAVQRWIKELRTYLAEQYLIAIAGNKCDLSDKRVVHTETARGYAQSVGAYFCETSAKNSININELFINAINLYRSTFTANNQSDPNRIVFGNDQRSNSSKCC